MQSTDEEKTAKNVEPTNQSSTPETPLPAPPQNNQTTSPPKEEPLKKYPAYLHIAFALCVAGTFWGDNWIGGLQASYVALAAALAIYVVQLVYLWRHYAAKRNVIIQLVFLACAFAFFVVAAWSGNQSGIERYNSTENHFVIGVFLGGIAILAASLLLYIANTIYMFAPLNRVLRILGWVGLTLLGIAVLPAALFIAMITHSLHDPSLE